MKKILIKILYFGILLLFLPLYLVVAFSIAFYVRNFDQKTVLNPRLVWGSTPIINNFYWSKAMRLAGYESETFTNGFYGKINNRSDWDVLIQDKYCRIPKKIKYYCAFLESLLKYDVFCLSFNGFFLGLTPLWRLEAVLLRLARKKTLLISYGSDVQVYQRMKSSTLLHGLLMSYPGAARKQQDIANRVDYWCRWADVVLTGFIGGDSLGRWDILVPSVLCLDTDQWKLSQRKSFADGISDIVYICHAPNHRGFKGTEFIVHAVDYLKSEGLKIELVLLEKLQNTVVKDILRSRVDILVEQVIAPGHGLNALEGMASGLPVISNLEDDSRLLRFRRWSYFSECPLVSASPENLIDVLRKLVTNPNLRHQLGQAGRAYVEKYHGLDSAQYLFKNVIDYLYGHRESLINLYHPILGEYPNRIPRVEHPLVNHRIVN